MTDRPEQNPAIEENFMKMLQMQNVDDPVVVAGRSIAQPNMLHAPALNLEEILRLHEQCQSVWRDIYNTLRKLSNQSDCTPLTTCPSSSDFPVAQ